MTTSDILTVISLAVAAWAIIDKKERDFIILFFSNVQLFVGGLLFVFIHWLIAFDWIRDKWLPELSVFVHPKAPHAEAWAYLVAVFLFLWVVLRIKFGFYHGSRLKEAQNLYKGLYADEEYDLLASYIDEYHINDIRKYVIGFSNLPKEERFPRIDRNSKWWKSREWLLRIKMVKAAHRRFENWYYNLSEQTLIRRLLRGKSKWRKAHDKLVSPKRINLAARVYNDILKDEVFIERNADRYPLLFAKAISGMVSEKSANESFVTAFLEVIFESKNRRFVGEIRAFYGWDSSLREYSSDRESPILLALLGNTKVAAKNHIWMPIGEEVIASFKVDSEQRKFLAGATEKSIDDRKWNTKVFVGIAFFDIMVKESIYYDPSWHMWLFYYHNFVKELTAIEPDEKRPDPDSLVWCYSQQFIVEIISNIKGWIELAIEQQNENRAIDPIRCLGRVLNHLSECDKPWITEEFKIHEMEWSISLYLTLSRKDVTLTRRCMEAMFRKPDNINIDHILIETDQGYRILLRNAWEKVDKFSYQDFEENGATKRFEDEVLNLLPI